MSLKFVFGPSGSGKSRKLYQEIIARSLKEPDRKFFFLVPDQFTMQTQKELVSLHERGGILNIDVLSFGRLSHHVLSKTGQEQTPVLDDTGKSLVLQKVALKLADRLPVLGSYLRKQGYIHEVKSAISEFMQYGIGEKQIEQLISGSAGRGALQKKLKDLAVLYQGFREYIDGNFITTEETLDVLGRNLSRCDFVTGSVVVFDSFTGFTPIQYRVIREIMKLAGETIVSLTLGEGEDPYTVCGEQELFYLTKKTVKDLLRLSEETGTMRQKDDFVQAGEKDRYQNSPALRLLEQNLFRYQTKPFKEKPQQIHLAQMTNPLEEVHQTGLAILRLVREKGMNFRDIAIILGDPESYAPYVENEFLRLEIPYYLDRTSRIVLNPMTEYIKSALELFIRDFSYESVFHYLRSGLSDLTMEEADLLEDYILETGVQGCRRYSRLFTRKTKEMGEEEEPLCRINRIRQSLMDQVEVLHGEKKATVSDYVERLYEFLVQNRIQEKLKAYEVMFTGQNQPAKAREYAQIFRLIMDLLNQIYELLGTETISLEEFLEILEAGFGEITVGTIPQNVDRVLAGDMERTRLKQVKALFFLGMNDGNIPKSGSTGGIISDLDREFLSASEVELAPSPRQKMYIQRFYLYMNMTKPSSELYLSYSKINSAGKSIRPAYLIDTVQKIFPLLTCTYPELDPLLTQVVSAKEGISYLSDRLRDYVQGRQESEGKEFYTLYAAYGEEGWEATRRQLTDAAFYQYRESALCRTVAQALYGLQLENSISRLETYAACACRHFLQYGLSLKERREFGFEQVDMGNLFHAVLEEFSHSLEQDENYTWFDFPEEYAQKAIHEIMEEQAAQYGSSVLYSTARNEYAVTRMERILLRTVLTLQNHLRKGEFVPEAYEVSFHSAKDLNSVDIALSEEERIRLQGRIDRIDTASDKDHIYVKVIDYKSGTRSFDLAALYYGLQLQLVVYMNAALEMEARKHPDKEIVPAAMLYYHVEDPIIETSAPLTEEEIREKILEKLKMKGLVIEDEEIAGKLDRDLKENAGVKSDVIPVEKNKNGQFSARSDMMRKEDFRILSGYVNRKMKEIGRQILDGRIVPDPYEKGKEEACTYCVYQKVCGFDVSLPGYDKRKLQELTKEQVFERIK